MKQRKQKKIQVSMRKEDTLWKGRSGDEAGSCKYHDPVLLLTSQPQRPVVLTRSPVPLPEHARRPRLPSSPSVLKTSQIPVRSVQSITRRCMCKLFLRNSSRVQICNPTESMALTARGAAALRAVAPETRTQHDCYGGLLP